ncbi:MULTISPECIES: SdrD B-like domain-containing protein [Microbacterium]|uniref:DUF7507 domain-containing protein n=1 Tax=Microbacterium TaxID=33882 RepID=UPI00146A0269|nr:MULTISPECIES: SdrD B-like domain-containing protein [Microbacterium]
MSGQKTGAHRARSKREARRTAVFATVVAVIMGTMLPMAGTPAAVAGPGSLISGIVWADANRDGLRDASESTKPGVTVQLLSSPGGAVIASTVSGVGGTYSFANVADGAHVVRVNAPGPFRFPATATGANDFVRAGQPLPGDPERGVSAAFTIAGATQVTGLDAGMQPIADLLVELLPEADACQGLAITGLPPFDASDGPGLDSGPGNCIVRTEDSVLQSYSVSLTGLPTGATVPNVVAQFTLSSPDGAALELVGPNTNGLPAGCLAAANGANPASSRTLNADGSITVTCNLGTMSSSVAAIQFAHRFTTDTPVPAHASVELHAYAGQGDAGMSNSVSGPEVAVTATAQWDLQKVLYPSTAVGNAGPDFTILNVGGTPLEGYLLRYRFNMVDLMGGVGGAELLWPVTFTDVLPEFPGARITECRSGHPVDGLASSPWTLTCPPVTEVQGTDGWELSIRPNSGVGADTGGGQMIMTVFVPLDEMNRAIDPTWQPGDDVPTGSFSYDNRAQDTDHWAMNGGELNFGNGQEPGWDGTGNNLATRTASSAAPSWDLQKNFRQGPAFTTQIIDGVPVEGYTVDYDFRILDLAGPENVGPWLDRPITFKDRLVTQPDAILLSCRELQPDPNVASTTCETGVQPADGWDISAMPNQRGFNNRRMDFIARLFLPLDDLPSDPCETGATIDLRNEAVDSDHWTIEGQPNNGTGFEPGWDGTTATGNNLDVRSVRPSTGECGTLTGNKQYIRNGFEVTTPTFGGDVVQSRVSLSANNARVSVDDLRMCDVFDVSVFELVPGTPRMGAFPSGSNVDPSDFVIEYAVGPNEVDTQAGPISGGVYPIDASSLNTAAAGCRTYAGPWATDPAAEFGADWLDSVNMVRIRPVDPSHVQPGPFASHLMFELETRTFYNGGPNAGEPIPSGVRLTNVGAWPTGQSGDGWATLPRQLTFSGMQLAVSKTVTPTQYLPGDPAVWDLQVSINRATIGATLLDLEVVDTIPQGLHFDMGCTQGLLPAGVTVSYDAATRQATFRAGDVEIETAPSQWVFHATNGAPRLRICTRVDTLAQPGDTYVNTVLARASNAENQPTATATIQVVGSGQMGITKSVDKPFVASGETYSWSLEWGNTSTVLSFLPPDVIDVLPWNGDGAADAPSRRDQFSSQYTGLAELVGPLAAPTYVRGGAGSVPGTWYYTTTPSPSVDHDPRDATNVDPAAPGGRWLTAAEVADFDDVTAVRFVSSTALPVQSRVLAQIAAVSTSNDLDNVYVNRAMIFSPTFALQPLLSNEPYVLMPGFTLGDLVWMDADGDGTLDGEEQGVPGVTVQVRDAGGDVIASAVTDAAGRWSVAALPAGTYTVHVPAAMFTGGGPLAGHRVSTFGSGDALDPNENDDNNNTASPDPAAAGLTSAPVTLEYVRDGDGDLTGGNGPSGDDVASLAAALIPDSFTAFTIDLAVIAASAIDIEKATNGEDADDPTGPFVPDGGEVRWTYVVTNTGALDLTDVTVTDDMVDAGDIDCDGTGSNVIPGPLGPGASVTCTATGAATAGQYANTGAVSALDSTGTAVTDEDPSHYFGAMPSVDIEKATNGQDADDPTGPLVTVEGDVRWTYVVTNTGNVPLTDVTVTDDLVAADDIDCGGTGSNVLPGPLAPGGRVTCVASGTAVAGQYTNLGTVLATGPEMTDAAGEPVPGVQVGDEDASHYLGIEPAVQIVKSTDGEDANEAPGVELAAGDDVEWTYVVTNTGTAPLTDVTVTDDRVESDAIDCEGTSENVIPGPLAPGASVTCTASGEAIEGQYANTGMVEGTGPATTDADGEPVAGEVVADADPSHYFGHFAEVDIEKAVNGEDADEAPGVPLTEGDDVEWTYVVTNTGSVPLTNIVVSDDLLEASEIRCDGTPSHVVAGPLAPGASFTCEADGVAIGGPYVNIGSVRADAPDLDTTVTDEDAAHYTGSPKTAIGGDGDLPATGGPDPTPLIWAGALGVVLGGILLLATRRRVSAAGSRTGRS